MGRMPNMFVGMVPSVACLLLDIALDIADFLLVLVCLDRVVVSWVRFDPDELFWCIRRLCSRMLNLRRHAKCNNFRRNIPTQLLNANNLRCDRGRDVVDVKCAFY